MPNSRSARLGLSRGSGGERTDDFRCCLVGWIEAFERQFRQVTSTGEPKIVVVPKKGQHACAGLNLQRHDNRVLRRAWR